MAAKVIKKFKELEGKTIKSIKGEHSFGVVMLMRIRFTDGSSVLVRSDNLNDARGNCIEGGVFNEDAE